MGSKTTAKITDGGWVLATLLDGDPRGMALYKRHYSYRKYADGREPKLFVGPGEKMVMLSFQSNALFVWRKFKDDSGQVGVNCAVFRNESPIKSSDLIQEAMSLAWQRWPGQRLYTYVKQKKVKSVNPGYCFKKAGWKLCGITKSGKLILETFPLCASKEAV